MIVEQLKELENAGLEVSDCILSEEDVKIGWLCSYIPEEIIYASGFHPVRLSGRGNPVGRADGLLHPNMCPFVRSILDDAMEGYIGSHSGIVIANSCDAMRRLFDAWKVFLKDDIIYYLDPPKGTDDMAVAYYTGQLRDFSRVLNQNGGKKITGDSLIESIKVFNKTRSLMSDVSRLAANKSLNGQTAFNIMQVAVRCNREKFNQRLARFLDGFSGQMGADKGARILLSGCIIDKPDLIRLMEEVGARVVVNELCTGNRQFDQKVTEDGDPFQALAERYLKRAPCARMMDHRHRIKYLLDLAEESEVDGVIYYIMKFCDHYMWEFPLIKQAFEERGIPVLDVEGDYMKGSFGPFKTRIQAFVETLQG